MPLPHRFAGLNEYLTSPSPPPPTPECEPLTDAEANAVLDSCEYGRTPTFPAYFSNPMCTASTIGLRHQCQPHMKATLFGPTCAPMCTRADFLYDDDPTPSPPALSLRDPTPPPALPLRPPSPPPRIPSPPPPRHYAVLAPVPVRVRAPKPSSPVASPSPPPIVDPLSIVPRADVRGNRDPIATVAGAPRAMKPNYTNARNMVRDSFVRGKDDDGYYTISRADNLARFAELGEESGSTPHWYNRMARCANLQDMIDKSTTTWRDCGGVYMYFLQFNNRAAMIHFLSKYKESAWSYLPPKVPDKQLRIAVKFLLRRSIADGYDGITNLVYLGCTKQTFAMRYHEAKTCHDINNLSKLAMLYPHHYSFHKGALVSIDITIDNGANAITEAEAQQMEGAVDGEFAGWPWCGRAYNDFVSRRSSRDESDRHRSTVSPRRHNRRQWHRWSQRNKSAEYDRRAHEVDECSMAMVGSSNHNVCHGPSGSKAYMLKHPKGTKCSPWCIYSINAMLQSKSKQLHARLEKAKAGWSKPTIVLKSFRNAYRDHKSEWDSIAK